MSQMDLSYLFKRGGALWEQVKGEEKVDWQ